MNDMEVENQPKKEEQKNEPKKEDKNLIINLNKNPFIDIFPENNNSNVSDILSQASRRAENIDFSKKEKKISVNAKKSEKKKGQIESFIDTLIKNGKVSSVTILPVLQETNRRATIEEAIFYESIIKSRIHNVKYSLNDLLNGKSFNYFMCNPGAFERNTSVVFTNDKLFWLCRMDNVINAKKDYSELLTCLNFKKQIINLQSVAVDQETSYRSAYFRDYNYKFSCVFTENINKDSLIKAVKSQGGGFGNINKVAFIKSKFKYENVDYTYAIFRTGETIVVADSELGNIENLCNNVKIYDSKKTMKEGEFKIIPIRNKSSSYLSQEVRLTDFCPCLLVFGNSIPYAFSFDMEFNMDLLENLLFTRFTKKYEGKILNKQVIEANISDYVFIENLVTWETIELFSNFLLIESATRFKDDVYFNFRNKIASFNEAFRRDKKSVNNARSIITRVLNLFTRFFLSFQNRVNTDVIEKCKDEYNKIKVKFDECDKEGDFVNTETLLVTNDLQKICLTIYNCVHNKAEKIKNIMSIFDSFFDSYIQKKGNQIMITIKRLGISIFSIFAVTNNNDQLINKIVTPSAFLGNYLAGDDDSSNLLIEKIDRKLKSEVKEDISEIELARNLAEFSDKESKEFAALSYLTGLTGVNEIMDDETDIGKIALTSVNEYQFPLDLNADLIAIGRTYLVKDEEVPFIPYKKIENYMDDEQMKELRTFYDSFNAKVQKTDAVKMLAKANISENIVKLRSSLNNNLIPPITGYVDEKIMEDLGIKMIDLNNVDPEVGDEIVNLRYAGISDDVINNYIRGKYKIKDLKEIELDDFEINEEDVNQMKQITNSKWGPNGIEYNNFLKRLDKDVAKKMKLKEGMSTISRKSRSFKNSLGLQARKRKKKNDNEEVKEKKKRKRKRKAKINLGVGNQLRPEASTKMSSPIFNTIYPGEKINKQFQNQDRNQMNLEDQKEQ